ncbi:hypothetical protein EVAR_10563_1 [Eumeta japonica]|uniref:Uncharacterized protein n=1 Tax=Eumeta variegata TaxID=151549 RepID=A0A4C1U1W2_EUMVA|nr:hypothetical protein EVAR_10563_1 [Eumeta japonica]
MRTLNLPLLKGAKSGKTRENIRSPGTLNSANKKMKDLGPGLFNKKQEKSKVLLRNSVQENYTKPGWKTLKSRKVKAKKRKSQPSEKLPKPPPMPIHKKPRRRPCPANKSMTLDKIHNSAAGDILITLSKESADRGQGLQKTIADILQQDAKVINMVSEENHNKG